MGGGGKGSSKGGGGTAGGSKSFEIFRYGCREAASLA